MRFPFQIKRRCTSMMRVVSLGESISRTCAESAGTYFFLLTKGFLNRYGFKIPRYQQIINHLTWMSHSQNLKRVSREHVIDLYLQPPVGKFRLMDFHHLERLVRDANRFVSESTNTSCFPFAHLILQRL